MAEFMVRTRAGEIRPLEGKDGYSLMELIRDAGIDEMIALCGGCCSCATCHVYVADGYADAMPPITEDESDLLESSEHRTAQSRLSCQLPWRPQCDGLSITIAPED